GTEHLHGGNVGFDKRVWTLESVTDSVLVLKYESPDGEEGYPGNLDVTLRFELTDDNELIHEYAAFTDMPTPVNLTHHSYFNLTNGDGTIGDTIVKINASYTLAQDDTSTVTGELLPVDNTRFDFRNPKRIDTNWNPETGYDQSFVVDKKENRADAEAWSEKSGIKLQLFTSEPIVHLYTAKYLSPMKGKDGKSYGPFSGFCLETQIHPNAINIPGFPDTILRPGQEYKHKTIYKILIEK
ncbi:MAG: aldose epimerase family protein, partial [Chitinophagaceae bacterium]